MSDNKKTQNKIVLTESDLDVEPLVVEPRVYPQLQKTAAPMAQMKSSGFWNANMRDSILAGVLAGVVAWLLGEAYQAMTDDRPTSTFAFYVSSAGYMAVIGAIIAATIGGMQGITSGVGGKGVRDGAIGFGVGLVGGFLGGLIGQFVYSSLLSGRGISMAQQVFARTVGWTLIGVAVGLAQAVPSKQRKKIVNGLLGGLAGGALGGLAFDFIGMLTHGGGMSRMFGVTAMAVAIGVAVTMVEAARKEAWLEVMDGPLAGKQFVIYGLLTKIGRHYGCDIAIGKDSSLLAEHCVIKNEGSRFSIEAMPQARTLVNGQGVTRAVLNNGDVICLGETSLRMCVKEMKM